MLISRRQFLSFLTGACFVGLPIGSLAAPRMVRAAKAGSSAAGAGTQDEVTTGKSGPKKESDASDSPSGGSQSSTKPGAGPGAGR